MNFQQLRSVREAIRCNFNLTEVANTLFTSQPGVSRQIRELEDELGIEIFERSGKRLIGLTAPGEEIIPIVERILLEAENLKRASGDFSKVTAGRLSIATTHTQARYALPKVIAEFKRTFPQVKLRLQQSPPEHIAELLLEGEADIGIATEALNNYPELIALPGYRWNHLVVVPPGHELLSRTAITLQDLSHFALITYDPGFTGRSHIDEAFAAENLNPDFVLTALDADVIKTYVEAGLGVGIIASMAFEPKRDSGLRAFDASHLFRTNTTRIAIRRGSYLRGFSYHFIELFAAHLNRGVISAAIAGQQTVDSDFSIPLLKANYANVLAHA